MKRREFLAGLAVSGAGLLSGCITSGGGFAPLGVAGKKPNIIFILTNLALSAQHAGKRMELSIELERLMRDTGYGAKPLPPQPRVYWGRKKTTNKRKKK